MQKLYLFILFSLISTSDIALLGSDEQEDLKRKFGPNAGDPLPAFDMKRGPFMSGYIQQTPIKIIEIPIQLADVAFEKKECRFSDDKTTMRALKQEIEKKYNTTGDLYLTTKNNAIIPLINMASLATLEDLYPVNYKIHFISFESEKN